MLKLQNVSKSFLSDGQSLEIIKGITLEFAKPEVVAVVGPNGSGKTTLLKIIAGLEQPTSGEVWWHNRLLILAKPRLGYLFQNCSRSLFPWQTVRQHFAFARGLGPVTPAEGDQQINQLLRRLRLVEHQARYPYHLSGGMQQIVALGRALLLEPELFLLDEPFGALDYHTSIKLQELFAEVWEERPVPTLLVTHTVDEAIYLADRIVLLSPGPSTILKEFFVNLPHPRRFEHRHDPVFLNLRQEILESMRGFL